MPSIAPPPPVAPTIPVVSRDEVCGALPPGFILDVVRYMEGQTEAPACFALGAALGALSSVAPIDLAIHHGGGPLYAPLYLLFLGASGAARKTAGVRIAKDLIDLVDPALVGVEPDSPEGLRESLIDQPQQTVIYEEMADFLGSTVQGSRLHPLRGIYTKTYDSGTVTRRLARGATRSPTGVRLTLLGASTVSFLEQYTTDMDWTGGFFSRWLFLVGRREQRMALTQADEGERQRLANVLAGYRDAVVGPCSGLAPTAAALWEDWYYRVDAQVESGETHPWMRGPLARAQNVALKVALLQALAAGEVEDGPWTLSEAALQVGLAVAGFHARSIGAIVEDMAGSDYQRWRRAVLEYLARGPRARGEIARLLRLPPRDLKAVVDGLVEEGRMERTVGRGNVEVLLPMTPATVDARTLLDVDEGDEGGGGTGGDDADDGPLPNVIAFPAPGPYRRRKEDDAGGGDASGDDVGGDDAGGDDADAV